MFSAMLIETTVHLVQSRSKTTSESNQAQGIELFDSYFKFYYKSSTCRTSKNPPTRLILPKRTNKNSFIKQRRRRKKNPIFRNPQKFVYGNLWKPIEPTRVLKNPRRTSSFPPPSPFPEEPVGNGESSRLIQFHCFCLFQVVWASQELVQLRCYGPSMAAKTSFYPT